MRIVTEKNSVCFIKDFFPPHILCGFTKRDIFKLTQFEDILRRIFSLKSLEFAYLIQTHSPEIVYINKQGLYKADGLFTSRSNLVLVVKTADCLPLYFSSSHTIGILHLGWRGALRGILDNVKGDLRDFKVCSGVGLRSCCYQVGEEFLGFDKFRKFLVRKGERLYFSPVEFVQKELERKGFIFENFLDLEICSFCNREFYSWRREKTTRRTFSFIFKYDLI